MIFKILGKKNLPARKSLNPRGLRGACIKEYSTIKKDFDKFAQLATPFKVDSSKISLLESPTHFYEYLMV